MQKSQSDAMVDAVLAPDPEFREQLLQKESADARSVAERRLVAVWMLVAMALAGTVAYLYGQPVSRAIIWGGIAGSLACWSVVWWRRRRPAS